MAQKLTFYPLGNAETCLLELQSGAKLLFDYATMNDGSETDERYDIKKELSSIKEFDVVMFSHAHDDHTKGSSEFFYTSQILGQKSRKCGLLLHSYWILTWRINLMLKFFGTKQGIG